jgi:hypothetical protein
MGSTDGHGEPALSDDNRNKTEADNDNHVTDPPGSADEKQPPPEKKSLRFYAIILALAFAGLLTALEATITSTALPTIIEALGGADLFIWVVNVYFLTMYATSRLPSLIPFADMTIQDCIPTSVRTTCRHLRTTLADHYCHGNISSR